MLSTIAAHAATLGFGPGCLPASAAPLLHALRQGLRRYTTAPLHPDDVPEVVGSVHSIESFSALDGPGVRFLVFMQGCGLRCVFCSNPDTWHMHRGKLTSSKDLAARLERVKPYLSQGDHRGGITLSGGEPLLQPEFAAALLLEARTRGLTTCIDTTGQGAKHSHWDKVLPHLDYVLFCIKSPIAEKYEWITRRKMDRALGFVGELERRRIPYWVRYVLLPGKTDGPEDVEALVRFCAGKRSMQAVEVLPYHLLGWQKWAAEGLEYPLAGVPTPTSREVNAFVEPLQRAGIPVLCGKLSQEA